MKPHQADIFLVMLQEKRGEAHGVAEHDKQDAGDLGVKGPGMPDTAAEQCPHPCRDLVA
jgi:hypothetical protein